MDFMNTHSVLATGFTSGGWGNALLILFTLIGILVVAGGASAAFNCYLAVGTRNFKKGLIIANMIFSFLIGLMLVGCGFILHPDAPHHKNWYFLGGGLLVLAISAVGSFRSLRCAQQSTSP